MKKDHEARFSSAVDGYFRNPICDDVAFMIKKVAARAYEITLVAEPERGIFLTPFLYSTASSMGVCSRTN